MITKRIPFLFFREKYMWCDPTKGTYDQKNRYSDYACIYKFLNWYFMGCNQKFFIYIIFQNTNDWKRVFGAFRAAAISSIARRVNCHFWIVGPFSRIASHVFNFNCKGRLLYPSEQRIEELEFHFSIILSPSFGHFFQRKKFTSRFVSRSHRSAIIVIGDRSTKGPPYTIQVTSKQFISRSL